MHATSIRLLTRPEQATRHIDNEMERRRSPDRPRARTIFASCTKTGRPQPLPREKKSYRYRVSPQATPTLTYLEREREKNIIRPILLHTRYYMSRQKKIKIIIIIYHKTPIQAKDTCNHHLYNTRLPLAIISKTFLSQKVKCLR